MRDDNCLDLAFLKFGYFSLKKILYTFSQTWSAYNILWENDIYTNKQRCLKFESSYIFASTMNHIELLLIKFFKFSSTISVYIDSAKY